MPTLLPSSRCRTFALLVALALEAPALRRRIVPGAFGLLDARALLEAPALRRKIVLEALALIEALAHMASDSMNARPSHQPGHSARSEKRERREAKATRHEAH